MRNLLVLTLLLSAFACGDDTTNPQRSSPDAGSNTDAGAIADMGAIADAAVVDDAGESQPDTRLAEDVGADATSVADAEVDMPPDVLPNDLCSLASTVEPGVVTGTTEDSIRSPTPSNLWPEAGSAKWFRYTFQADTPAQLRATGLDFNIWLGAMSSCPTSSSISGTFKSSRDGEISWDGVAGETVYIVVTGEDREEGQFELELTLGGS